MSSLPDLLSCPFCDSDAVSKVYYDDDSGKNDIRFGCPDKDCIGPYIDDFASCHETGDYIRDLTVKWHKRS